jgi:hypothetical protein
MSRAAFFGPADHTACDDAILPLFCPTGQTDFVKSKKLNAAKEAATVQGVVFDIFVARPRKGSDWTCLAPLEAP